MLVALMCNNSQKYSYALAPKSSASANSFFGKKSHWCDVGSIQRVQERPTVCDDLESSVPVESWSSSTADSLGFVAIHAVDTLNVGHTI